MATPDEKRAASLTSSRNPEQPVPMMENLTQSAAQSVVAHALLLGTEKYADKGLSVAVCDPERFSPRLRTHRQCAAAEHLTSRCARPTRHRVWRVRRWLSSNACRRKPRTLYFGDEKFAAMPGGAPVFNDRKQLLGAVAIGGISAQEDVEAVGHPHRGGREILNISLSFSHTQLI